MRKINVVEPSNAEWKEWRRKCEKATDEVIEKIGCKQEWTKNPGLYNGQKKEFYFKRKKPFYRRCAYCERDLNDLDALDHYRPAKKITNIRNKVIQNHEGYYWLTYEWKNLLPACNLCNTVVKRDGEPTGKGNRFPLEFEDARAKNPGEEKNERPLLLNPTIDNPDEHFEYDFVDSRIISKAESKKGDMTIRILGFHIREELREDWQKAENEARNELAKCLTEKNTREAECKMIIYDKKVSSGKEAYSFVKKKVCEKFINRKLLEV